MHRAPKITAIAVLLLAALTLTAATSGTDRLKSDRKPDEGRAFSGDARNTTPQLPDATAAGNKLLAPEPGTAVAHNKTSNVVRLPLDVPRALEPVEPTFDTAIRLPGLPKSPPELPATKLRLDTRAIGVPKPPVAPPAPSELDKASSVAVTQPDEVRNSASPVAQPRPRPKSPPVPTTQSPPRNTTIHAKEQSVVRLPAVPAAAQPSPKLATTKLIPHTQPAKTPPEPILAAEKPVTAIPGTAQIVRLPTVPVSAKPRTGAPLVQLVSPTKAVTYRPPSAAADDVALTSPDRVAPPAPPRLQRLETVSTVSPRTQLLDQQPPRHLTRPPDPIAIHTKSILKPDLEITQSIPSISTSLLDPHVGAPEDNTWPAPHVLDRTDLQDPRLFSHETQVCEWNDSITWPCSTCGQTCCCCNQVCWRARSEAVFLHRSRADASDDFLVECFQTGIGVRAEDLGLDFHTGPRFTLIRDNQSGGHDLEATYYTIDEWSGTDFHIGDLIIRDTLGIGVGTGIVRYETQLQNAEVNLTSDLTNWTQFLMGFRWLQLDEFSAIDASTAAFPNFHEDVNVVNDLYGGQFGFRSTLWDHGGYVTVDGWLKSGIYRNRIRRSTNGFGTSPLRKDETSWINELDVLANYEITPCLAFSLGYQVMWVSNVALAPDQFLSPNVIYSDETAFLHGLRLGITFTH